MSRLALAIAVKGAWDADQLVAALEAAGVPAGTEVHVACDPQFAPSAPPPSLFVHVTTGASLFELWGVAIANSSSAWVAVLHAAALPAPGWFAAMTREIERDGQSDGYWGPIEPKPAISADRMLGYLTEYCQFHRPLEPGLREVPGSNLVLPRERIGAATDFSKTRLLRQGLRAEICCRCSRALCAAESIRGLLPTTIQSWSRLCRRAHAPPAIGASIAALRRLAIRPRGPDRPARLAPQGIARRHTPIAAGNPARRNLLVGRRADRLRDPAGG